MQSASAVTAVSSALGHSNAVQLCVCPGRGVQCLLGPCRVGKRPPSGPEGRASGLKGRSVGCGPPGPCCLHGGAGVAMSLHVWHFLPKLPARRVFTPGLPRTPCHKACVGILIFRWAEVMAEANEVRHPRPHLGLAVTAQGQAPSPTPDLARRAEPSAIRGQKSIGRGVRTLRTLDLSLVKRGDVSDFRRPLEV